MLFCEVNSMISFYKSRYTANQLRIVKAMLLEGLYFLQDNFVECKADSTKCKYCEYKCICKDFQRTITHVEKLVENENR